MFFSLILYRKLSSLDGNEKHEIINNIPAYRENEIVEKLDSLMDQWVYDLDKNIIQANYSCTLKKYNDNTKVSLSFLDENNKEYLYEMEKQNNYTFIYNKEIPLLNYKYSRVIVDLGDDNKNIENTEVDLEYLTRAFVNKVQIYMPKDEKSRLMTNQVCYKQGYNSRYMNDERRG